MTNTAHVVLSAAPSWGHLRPLCTFAAKLVAERPVTVTLLIPNGRNVFAMSGAEIARCLAVVEKPKGDLRVVAFGEPSQMTMQSMPGAARDVFEPLWNALVAELSIKCSVTEKQYAAVAKPSMIVLDGFQYALFPVIRATQPSVPICVWQSGAAANLAHLIIPPRFGGPHKDLLTEFTPEECVKGRPVNITGKLLNAPGMPLMYDWELFPASMPWLGDGVVIQIEHIYAKALAECDALFTTFAPGYDGNELLFSIDKWSTESHKSMYHLGPMRPFKAGTADFDEATLVAEMNAAPPGIGEKVQGFLDNAMSAKGECSVVYICFGTNFWPMANPDHVWALIDALVERDIAFILSHPSAFAKVPERILSQFGPSSSANGLVIPWSPQQTVLSHKAVGWFVTHGGAGGTMDALTQGVPMIGWPLVGDQPGNIAYLVHTADVAFELVEVRTGAHGLKPLYASGKTPTGTLDAFRTEFKQVLDDMAGEVGARKRANARRMQGSLAKAWNDDGPARRAFNALIEHYDL